MAEQGQSGEGCQGGQGRSGGGPGAGGSPGQGSQGSQGSGGCCSGGGCRCQCGCCRGEGDHDEETRRMWEGAYWKAFKELQVEAIKAKLKATWGPRMEKTASDLVAAQESEYAAFQKMEAARQAYEAACESWSKTQGTVKEAVTPEEEKKANP